VVQKSLVQIAFRFRSVDLYLKLLYLTELETALLIHLL